MRLSGGSSTTSLVISGVPYGTVRRPLLFLILMSDIDIGVLNAEVVSFADDTQLYSKILYVENCDSLQSDLNCVYDWAKTNNMVLTPKNLCIYLFLQMYLLLVIMLMLMLAHFLCY